VANGTSTREKKFQFMMNKEHLRLPNEKTTAAPVVIPKISLNKTERW
jgi:hypothetical protein